MEPEEPPAAIRLTNRTPGPLHLFLELLCTEGDLPAHSTAEIQFHDWADAEGLDFSDGLVTVWTSPDHVTVLDGPGRGQELESWGAGEINHAPRLPITNFRIGNETGRPLAFRVVPEGPELSLPAGQSMELETTDSADGALAAVAWAGNAVEVRARAKSLVLTRTVELSRTPSVTSGVPVWPPEGAAPRTAPFKYAFSGTEGSLEPAGEWPAGGGRERLRTVLHGMVPGGNDTERWVLAWVGRNVGPKTAGNELEASITWAWLRGRLPIEGAMALPAALPVEVFVPLDHLRPRQVAEDVEMRSAGKATFLRGEPGVDFRTEVRGARTRRLGWKGRHPG